MDYPEFWTRKPSNQSSLWQFQFVHRKDNRKGRVITYWGNGKVQAWHTDLVLAFHIVDQVSPLDITIEKFDMLWNVAVNS